MRSYYEIQNSDAPSPYFFPPMTPDVNVSFGSWATEDFWVSSLDLQGFGIKVGLLWSRWAWGFGQGNATHHGRGFFDRRTGGFITAWRTHQPLPTASCLPGTEPLGNTTRAKNVLQRPNHLVHQPWVFVVFVNANIRRLCILRARNQEMNNKHRRDKYE